ncbi:phospholipid/cholesterol/gamma-HCH transport system permease protein [Catalinimonas alkaloidigena]|uniref:MlaE family ABC transporter permease n=1 Tax=Catalinimonas alkaloidigena TaxID=1075417 RepID=UPI002404B02B|nr:ABC transporter permease [Catalinimonas alkaloidigena]MDF9797872.1 phospholipid/cholesterol/gamma-HCH transport system permease protein [Catalinimonas alkaloidigena]
MFTFLPKQLRQYLIITAELSQFAKDFLQELFRPPYEFDELMKQSYRIGYQSLPLVGTTGFIMGVVLTLQSRPTLIEFGAESWMPSMVGISIVREIGPVITALICAGKVGSSIGAELGSMKVTEQIDAMEVSGNNPFKYLVVTRVLAATLMLPVLVIFADIISLVGSFLVENIKGGVGWTLYFNQVFANLHFGDIIPSIGKSFFFGFAIGLVGCYQGYCSEKGTEGVGAAANTAVVMASMLVFLLDLLAVLVADIFYEL